MGDRTTEGGKGALSSNGRFYQRTRADALGWKPDAEDAQSLSGDDLERAENNLERLIGWSQFNKGVRRSSTLLDTNDEKGLRYEAGSWNCRACGQVNKPCERDDGKLLTEGVKCQGFVSAFDGEKWHRCGCSFSGANGGIAVPYDSETPDGRAQREARYRPIDRRQNII